MVRELRWKLKVKQSQAQIELTEAQSILKGRKLIPATQKSKTGYSQPWQINKEQHKKTRPDHPAFVWRAKFIAG